MGTIPLAQPRGAHPGAGPGLRGNTPESALGWGAGRSPESPPDAHIRAQEGVGPALSWAPSLELGARASARSQGAPGPPTASPNQPQPPPPGPSHGRLAWPHLVTQGLCVARPGPARPSLAGPRLPEGLDRTSPLARRGAEGAGQGLQASLAPGRAGEAVPSLGRGTHPFCPEIWGPSPQAPLGSGVPSPTLMSKGSFSCLSLGVRSTIQNTLWVHLSQGTSFI